MTPVDPCVVHGKNPHAMTLGVVHDMVCEKNTHAMTLVDPCVVFGKNTHAMTLDPCVVCEKNTHPMTLSMVHEKNTHAMTLGVVHEKNRHAMTLVDPYVVCLEEHTPSVIACLFFPQTAYASTSITRGVLFLQTTISHCMSVVFINHS